MAKLSDDDVRDLRQIKAWKQKVRHSAQQIDPQPKHWPRASPQRDWSIINVRNDSALKLGQWSPVQIYGLVDPTDQDLADGFNCPKGLHPDRLWKCGYESGLNQPARNWRYSLTHAVITTNLDIGQIGTAVIKGVVPGRFVPNVTTASEYLPTWVSPGYGFVFANGIYCLHWSGADLGLDQGHASEVLYAWDTATNSAWGLININCGYRPPMIFEDYVSVFGLDVGQVVPQPLSGTPRKIPFFVGDLGFAGGPFWSSRDASGGTDSSSLFLHRPMAATASWSATWDRGIVTGQLIPGRADSLLLYPNATFQLFGVYTPFSGAVTTLKLFEHVQTATVGHTTSWSFGRQWVGSNFLIQPPNFGADQYPVKFQLHATGVGNLTNPVLTVTGRQWGAYPIDIDGVTQVPIRLGGGGPPSVD